MAVDYDQITRQQARLDTTSSNDISVEFLQPARGRQYTNEVVMQMSATDYRHVSFALELIMLRSGILYTPDCEWSRVQIDCMLTAVGTC